MTGEMSNNYHMCDNSKHFKGDNFDMFLFKVASLKLL